MDDLFETASDRLREAVEVEAMRARFLKLERDNMQLRIMLGNALSALRPLWNIQARAVRKAIRENLA